MSVDQKISELIKNTFEKGGLKVKNTPIQGDAFRLVLQTLKNEELDTMEIYKIKGSEMIVFSGMLYLVPSHHEKYRNFDDDKRKRFDNKLDELLKSMTDKYEITEDEKGFGVFIHDEIYHEKLNTNSLQQCYSNVNEPLVKTFNFFMDVFWDKIQI